jgi:hypothetical protein
MNRHERRKAKALNEVFGAFDDGKTTEAEFHAALRDRCGYKQSYIDEHAEGWREARVLWMTGAPP